MLVVPAWVVATASYLLALLGVWLWFRRQPDGIVTPLAVLLMALFAGGVATLFYLVYWIVVLALS